MESRIEKFSATGNLSGKEAREVEGIQRLTNEIQGVKVTAKLFYNL